MENFFKQKIRSCQIQRHEPAIYNTCMGFSYKFINNSPRMFISAWYAIKFIVHIFESFEEFIFTKVLLEFRHLFQLELFILYKRVFKIFVNVQELFCKISPRNKILRRRSYFFEEKIEIFPYSRKQLFWCLPRGIILQKQTLDRIRWLKWESL